MDFRCVMGGSRGVLEVFGCISERLRGFSAGFRGVTGTFFRISVFSLRYVHYRESDRGLRQGFREFLKAFQKYLEDLKKRHRLQPAAV